MKKEKVIKGTGNIFKDLGFENADEMLTKVKLAYQINQRIDQKKLTQEAIARLLQISQSKISLLRNGKLFGFSVEKLRHFLNCVTLSIP